MSKVKSGGEKKISKANLTPTITLPDNLANDNTHHLHTHAFLNSFSFCSDLFLLHSLSSI